MTNNILPDEPDDTVTRIDPKNVQQEFVDYPGLLSHWGARYADAIEEAAATAERLKDTEAEVFIELSASKKDLGGTEAMLKARLRLDSRVKLARRLAEQAEARKVRFQHKVMAALYAKKEMLISLGAHQRAELSGDPIIRHDKPRAERPDLGTLENEAGLR